VEERQEGQDAGDYPTTTATMRTTTRTATSIHTRKFRGASRRPDEERQEGQDAGVVQPGEEDQGEGPRQHGWEAVHTRSWSECGQALI